MGNLINQYLIPSSLALDLEGGNVFPFRLSSRVLNGYYNRICPGRYLAYSAVWIAVASLLTVFNIEKARDREGRIIDPGEEYDSALAWSAFLINFLKKYKKLNAGHS